MHWKVSLQTLNLCCSHEVHELTTAIKDQKTINPKNMFYNVKFKS